MRSGDLSRLITQTFRSFRVKLVNEEPFDACFYSSLNISKEYKSVPPLYQGHYAVAEPFAEEYLLHCQPRGCPQTVKVSIFARFLCDCDVILHLGAHRTGTTSLQFQLDNAALPHVGVSALTPPRTDKRTDDGLRSAFADFQRLRKNPLRAFVRLRMHRNIKRLMLARTTKRVVVSDEMFLGPIFGQDGTSIYPEAEKWLKDCAAFLGPSVSEIHLVVRSYADFLTSAYAMRAVYAKGVGDLRIYQKELVRCRRGWPEVVADIRAAFPGRSIRVWVFPDNLKENRLFEALTGLSEAPQRPTHLNASVSAAGIAHALAHKSDRDYDPDDVLAKFQDGARLRVFTDEQRATLDKRFLADLALLPRDIVSDTSSILIGDPR
ncbi:hypothetical protein SAMN05421665_0031 [Yoonia rosea]|uniref:Sulfotransferase family protein n=1 Tax=Yoonia rosea TaxID=287098 RepID=A0A1R3W995_9RHOB|nr:hypothetical protein SAMN05421665_0031 [Yoonia rosea]